MARHTYQGTFKDGNGRVVTEGTISVYLAGGNTAADVYTASAGGSAVNSVTSDSTDGSFLFWVDDTDYGPSQLFKVTLSKTNFTSKSYDNVKVYPSTAGHTVPDVADDTIALLDATQTFTNKTLTAPVIATIINTGTVTLPTDTDTLVGRDTTDTLTNKTLTSPIINSPSSSGDVYSGTYSPGHNEVANCNVTTGGTGKYMRVGNTVTLGISDIITSATVGGTLAQFTLDLPIASAFTNSANGGGAGASDSGSAIVPAKVEAYPSTDTMFVEYYAAGTGPNTMGLTFTYQII